METNNVQVLLFQHIKTLLPPQLSVVDEIATVLEISTDSAYRRIRGDKPISVVEMQKLCVHYKVSIDQFLNLQSDSFIFSGNLAIDVDYIFDNWLEEVLKQYTIINTFDKRHFYYFVKDMPFYVFLTIPELAAFKYFVWKRNFFSLSYEVGGKFTFDYPGFEEHFAMGLKIINVCNSIPTTEIWNTESVNITLQQIEYYREIGCLTSKDHAIILFDKVEQLVNHLEKEAELGLKFIIGEQPNSMSAPYRMFNVEGMVGDNSSLAELDDMKVTFLNHSFMHFIGTRDESFNNAIFSHFNKLMRRSTLISTSDQRDRIRFFNRLRNEIQRRKAMLT